MRKLFRPFYVFLLLLLVIAVTEMLVMYLLPLVRPASNSLANLLDALLLSAFSAPFIWMLIIRPTRIVAVQSGHALSQSEERYHTLFDNMLNGFAYCKVLFHEDGRARDFVYLDVNSAFGRVTGLENPVGKRLSEVFPGFHEAQPHFVEACGRVARTGNPEYVETEYHGAWFFTSLFSPEPGHVVGIFENTTERKLAEKALVKAKDDWERTFDAITDPVMILDTKHRVIRANKAMTDRVGEVVCGEDGICRDCVNDPRKVAALCPHSRMLLDGKPHSLEMYDPRLGEHFLVAVSPLFGPDGELQGSIHVSRDITESKNLEKQLQHSQKMEAVGTLAGGVAHDFNNILTAIIGYGNLLTLQMREDDPMLAQVKAILLAAERAADLTRSLLTFSRKQKVELKATDMNGMVLEAQKMLSRLIREDIEVKIALCERELTVLADTGQLEQVLMNLATNSQDAIEGTGAVTICTELVELDQEFRIHHGYGVPGHYVLLTYSDTGSGMDEWTQRRVFEPFFTTKETGKGTGLGLSIVYGIVKQHHGYINCYSEPGKGTTFRVYLPITDAQSQKAENAPRLLLPSGSEKILVAEDDESSRQLIKDLLERFGYSVVTASDGAEAVRQLKQHKDDICLALLDTIMPKMNGRDAYQEMVQIKPELKVIFTSGYPAHVLAQKEIMEPGLNFLSKPIHPRELLLALRSLLDGPQLGGAAA